MAEGVLTIPSSAAVNGVNRLMFSDGLVSPIVLIEQNHVFCSVRNDFPLWKRLSSGLIRGLGLRTDSASGKANGQRDCRLSLSRPFGGDGEGVRPVGWPFPDGHSRVGTYC
jgi:hypothetical protein